jgi:lipoprotein-anchoring transpeptidase ErfK/SrfK
MSAPAGTRSAQRTLRLVPGKCLLAAVVTLAAAGVTSPAAASTAVPAPARAPGAGPHELALLLTPHLVRPALGRVPTHARTLPSSAPITGGQSALPVVGHATRNGTRWLRVMLPGRPNGALGWITRRGTTSATTHWQLVVRTASRRVNAYRDGRLVRSFVAIVGKPSTPTPRGRFFVEESIAMRPGDSGGPFALATSARSNVLQEFDGGPGQIGIHGVDNLGGTPGTAVSHGCVRLTGAAIRWLVTRIRPGVTVTITR